MNPLPFRSFIIQKLTTSTHRASLYLYISVDRDPWVGRLNLNFFTLFLGGLPFDSTYYKSLSAHPAESSPYLYPKFRALCPMTITRGFCYPTRVNFNGMVSISLLRGPQSQQTLEGHSQGCPCH